MARTAIGGLSQHATKGFRIKIGTQANGKPKTFWLGHHRSIADYWADTLRGQFSHMKGDGRDTWTAQDIEAVTWYVQQFKDHLNGLRRRHALDVKELQQRGAVFDAVFGDGPAVVVKPTPKLYSAIDTFVLAFKGKALSESHKDRTGQLLDDLKHYRTDIQLTEIDRVWLQSLTDQIKARPKSRVRQTPLAPLTVRNMLRAWSKFFDWLDANADSPRFGHWQAPRRWQELFAVRMNGLMSKAERDTAADGPKHLTATQVVSLYKAARNDVHRICVLLGTFAALGQREIASLRRDEFDLDAGILTHRRSKTGQIGKFWIPAEAVKLIRRYFTNVRTDDENTAFFTGDGSKLVTESSDAIRQAWSDIVDRVIKDGVEIEKGRQGFYCLRRFTADYAMRNGGPVLRDAVLAHAANTVGAKHYSNARDFNAVYDVGRKLHAELTAAGMFSINRKTAKAKPAKAVAA